MESDRGSGLCLSPFQEQALTQLLELRKRRVPCTVLMGPGGSGKTTILREFMNRCGGPQKFILLATTNTAAVTLSDATGQPVYTCDTGLCIGENEFRFITYRMNAFDPNKMLEGRPGLQVVFDALSDRVSEVEYVVVDEMSMLTDTQLFCLVRNLALLARRARQKDVQIVKPGKYAIPYPTYGSFLARPKDADPAEWAPRQVWLNWMKTTVLKLAPWMPKILLVGDFMQLEPVSMRSATDHMTEGDLWKQVLTPTIVALDGNMRAKHDPEYASFLKQLRLGVFDEAAASKLIRVVPYRQMIDELQHSTLHSAPTPTVIVYRKDTADRINTIVYDAHCRASGARGHRFEADDTMVCPPRLTVLATVLDGIITDKFNEELPKKIDICVGLEVILISKVDLRRRLVKGRRCRILGVGLMERDALTELSVTTDSPMRTYLVPVHESSPGSSIERLANWTDIPREYATSLRVTANVNAFGAYGGPVEHVVLIQMDDGDRYILSRTHLYYYHLERPRDGTRASLQLLKVRRQFPFLHATAMTTHRVQGMTIDGELIVHNDAADGGVSGRHAIYVALSRGMAASKVRVTVPLRKQQVVVNQNALKYCVL